MSESIEKMSDVAMAIALFPQEVHEEVKQRLRDSVKSTEVALTYAWAICCFEGKDKMFDLTQATSQRVMPELIQLCKEGVLVKMDPTRHHSAYGW